MTTEKPVIVKITGDLAKKLRNKSDEEFRTCTNIVRMLLTEAMKDDKEKTIG